MLHSVKTCHENFGNGLHVQLVRLCKYVNLQLVVIVMVDVLVVKYRSVLVRNSFNPCVDLMNSTRIQGRQIEVRLNKV